MMAMTGARKDQMKPCSVDNQQLKETNERTESAEERV